MIEKYPKLAVFFLCLQANNMKYLAVKIKKFSRFALLFAVFFFFFCIPNVIFISDILSIWTCFFKYNWKTSRIGSFFLYLQTNIMKYLAVKIKKFLRVTDEAKTAETS